MSVISGRPAGRIGVAIAVALAAGACSGTAIDAQEDSGAVLDVERQQIIFPIESYVISGTNSRLVERANTARVSECLEKAGFGYPESSRDWQNEPLTHDRLFGPWNLQWVSQHGYDYPPSDETIRIEEENDLQPEGFNVAVLKCTDATELLPLHTVTDGVSLASLGYAQSYMEAQSDAEWLAATEEWKQCLRAAGFGIGDEPDSWVPNFPATVEGEIRAAIADVECKQETGLVQRLADIMAARQHDFIAENEAALEALKVESQDVVEQARSELNEG